MNKSKSKRETPLPNTTPTILDGQAFTEDMLRTFLDWSFLNDTKDVRMFMHLWNTGYFKSEPNPISSEALTEKVMRCAEKARKA